MSIIPVTEWPRVISLPDKQLVNPSISECVEAGYRLLPARPETPVGKRIKSETIVQDPDNAARCMYEMEYEDDPNYQMLAMLSAIYKKFLTDEWTTCLRSRGLILPDQVVDQTVGTPANMMYLLQLRVLDAEANKPTYSYFKNEFESFRINIERLGGDLGNLP